MTMPAQTGGLAVASPMDIVFSDYDVVQPDIVFLTAESMRTVSLMDRVRQSPDLAVEVLSPSTASNDRGRKMRMFQRYGVPEYWIVDPIEETIEIYGWQNLRTSSWARFQAATTMRSAVLPDLTLAPASRVSVVDSNLPISNLPILGQLPSFLLRRALCLQPLQLHF